MNEFLTCPEPLPLARLARGDGSPAEFAALHDHLAQCAACRDEWTALEALNGRAPADAWSLAAGAETDLPDTLWRSIEAARGAAVPAAAAARRGAAVPVVATADSAPRNAVTGLSLGLRMGAAGAAVRSAVDTLDELTRAAGRAVRTIDWLSLLSGEADLHPVTAAPVRGALSEVAAGDIPAVRLTSGARDLLLRRSGERLTVVVTESGEPLSGCRVTVSGPGADAAAIRDERTDTTGIVVFRSLPAGEYRVDIEGERS
jgi:hypothetical protein